MKDLVDFINSQLSQWPLACENFRALRKGETKKLTVGGLEVKAQFNPARIGSSAAKTDSRSLNDRPCFLCPENRYKEQISIGFDARKGRRYDILVNPFPVFTDHLVIALDSHREQSIWKRFVDLLDLSRAYQDFIFFYNGPKCGASAPDHHHFQAAGRGRMPLENDVDRLLDSLYEAGRERTPQKNDVDRLPDPTSEAMPGRMPFENNVDGFLDAASDEGGGVLRHMTSFQDADLFHYKKFTTGIFVLRGRTVRATARLFYRLLDCAPLSDDDREPRFNLFTYFKAGEYRCIVIFRTRHRSSHYFSDGPDHLTMSPGCVDMAGLFIVPVREDFTKLDVPLLSAMLAEVSVSPEVEEMICRRLTRTQRKVEVGIMSAKEIVFEIRSDGAGARRAVYREGKVEYDGTLFDELYFEARPPSTMFAEPTFILHNVTIGKGFHWERTESQRFAGALKIIVTGEELTAVNVVGVEDYLLSVISSEMNSAASLEFLKAHAVISRSWVIARIGGAGPAGEDDCREVVEKDGEIQITSWYGRSQHADFDVCADDHCQRYQGVSRAVGKNVRAAIDATWGEILTYGGEVCDARFSKCCGGTTELFSTCWEERDLPYLQALPDTEGHSAGGEAGPSGPRPFCDTSDKGVLSNFLNDYDRETADFYRWAAVYGRAEISALISRNTGVDIGLLSALEPVETGPSGRIKTLRIRGDKAVLVVGKELEIRKTLSTSHLKSSAFVPVYLDANGSPVDSSAPWVDLVLRGKGWGHGVGLCQIGAAVMAFQGASYDRILSHYYPGSVISSIDSIHPHCPAPAADGNTGKGSVSPEPEINSHE